MPRTTTTSTRIAVETFNWQTPLTGLSDIRLVSWVPGQAGHIVSLDFYVDVVTTTGGDASTVTPAVNGTSTTGGACALTSANTDGAVGDKVAGSAITGGNSFDADDVISLVGSNTTAFAEGAGTFVLTVEYHTQP